MIVVRLCSRTACHHTAVATLTYAYADSTAVLGPLSHVRIPGAFDLCAIHAERTSVPRGWDVVRLPMDGQEPVPVPDDDLLALAEAVRAIGLRHDEVDTLPHVSPVEPPPVRTVGHLRLLPGLHGG